MALTVQYTPPVYSSFNDDLVYTVLSGKVADPVTYPNFKYIGDLYIDGVLIARIKKVADPSTGVGVFNVGQIVRSYNTMVFDPAPGIVSQEAGDAEFNLTVQMKFGEEYSYTDFLDITVDSARIFYNNYNRRLFGAFSSLAAKANGIASNTPYGKVLFNSGYYLIPYFPTNTTPVPFIVTPTGGGSGYSTTFTPTNPYDLQLLNISPGGINAVHPGAIAAGTTSYTVSINGQVIFMEVVCESRYTSNMIHFLNQYGGFDSKLFNKVSRKSYDITKTDFGKLPFNVDGSGLVTFKNSNGVYNETRSVYSSQYKEKVEMNSDFITDAEYAWLSDLMVSPMVYLEDGGYFYPIVLTDNNYEARKTINDNLTNITIKAEFGTQLNAQFR